MAALLDAEFRAGVFGLSYGLEYVPGIYSETPELAALGRVVARHDGVAMSHMRSENDDAIEASIDELIASAAGARAHISHLKVVFGHGERRARALLDFIAAKRRQGISLTADEYPYNAGYTRIGILFPEWALPPTDYAAVVAQRRQELYDHLGRRMTRRGGPEALLFGTPPHAGKTLAQVAQEAGRPLCRHPHRASAPKAAPARISPWTRRCRTRCSSIRMSPSRPMAARACGIRARPEPMRS